MGSRAKTTTEKLRSVDNAAEGSSDSSDGEQQLMTVTLTPDEETVSTVSSSKYHRQIFATLLVKGNPRPVRFQLDTGGNVQRHQKGRSPWNTGCTAYDPEAIYV